MIHNYLISGSVSHLSIRKTVLDFHFPCCLQVNVGNIRNNRCKLISCYEWSVNIFLPLQRMSLIQHVQYICWHDITTLSEYLVPSASEAWGTCCFHRRVSVHTGRGVSHLHPIILPLVPCPFWGYPLPAQWQVLVLLFCLQGDPSTQQAVCLLRSRRRTVLLITRITDNMSVNPGKGNWVFPIYIYSLNSLNSSKLKLCEA